MNTVFLDIETIPLPVECREAFRPTEKSVKFGNLKDPAKRAEKVRDEVSKWEAGGACALDSMQCQVAMIGYAVNNGEYVCLSLSDYFNEEAMLREWWGAVKTADYIVGHNIRFDASKLVHRSWLNGIIPPHRLVDDLMAYRPKIWCDTMTEWSLGDRQARYVSLKNLCAAFGVKVKDSPVDGSLFYEFFDAQPDEAAEYNRQDVVAVRSLWEAMGRNNKISSPSAESNC